MYIYLIYYIYIWTKNNIIAPNEHEFFGCFLRKTFYYRKYFFLLILYAGYNFIGDIIPWKYSVYRRYFRGIIYTGKKYDGFSVILHPTSSSARVLITVWCFSKVPSLPPTPMITILIIPRTVCFSRIHKRANHPHSTLFVVFLRTYPSLWYAKHTWTSPMKINVVN